MMRCVCVCLCLGPIAIALGQCVLRAQASSGAPPPQTREPEYMPYQIYDWKPSWERSGSQRKAERDIGICGGKENERGREQKQTQETGNRGRQVRGLCVALPVSISIRRDVVSFTSALVCTKPFATAECAAAAAATVAVAAFGGGSAWPE